MRFDRITVEPGRCGGQPTVRGLRIPVATIVRDLSSGMTREEVLDSYPELEDADITQALAYAAWLASDAYTSFPDEAT